MANVIFLIEDKIVDKNDILDLLQQHIPQDIQDEYIFEWLPSEEQEQNGYQFYTENILQCIAERKDELEAHGNHMGLLLDLTLTADELKKSGQSFYPEAGLAKKIYFQYKNDIPIYIVTVSNTFGAQCDVIMGEDVSDRYVTKRSLLKYKMPNSINNLFEFYQREFNNEG